MFNVGDKVQLKKEFYKEKSFTEHSNGRNYKKAVASLAGKVVEVKRLFPLNEQYFEVEENESYRFNTDCFELVESAKVKAKVGDKIRITRYQSGDKVGTVFEVVYIKGAYIGYKSLGRKGKTRYASGDAYEIVTEPEVKEVKRVAKVGEWIKIVAEEDAKGLYKNGDILKFNGLVLGICITVDGFERVIYHREYVVLEGYEPTLKPAEVKEVSRRAKIGEYIKIVRPYMTFGDYKKGDILKVVRIGENGVYIECGTVVWLEEYVVLENYVPEEKESEIPKEEPKKQIAKVGDFIELTVYNFGDSVGTVAEVIEVNEANVKYKTARSMRGYYYARHDSYKIVEPPKRKWTEEEITKAKCFLAEELIKGTYKFTYRRNRIDCSNGVETATAKCSSKDEYNQYIGAVVAYCKVSGIKIPEFIRD